MSLQIEALSPIMWTIIIAVALVLIAAVVFTWKSSAMSTRKMVTIAMLTAVYVVLNFAGTVRLGWINISVASLPVIVGAMLYGPVGGLLVGLLGAFMGQLLTYGVTATTILWILPGAGPRPPPCGSCRRRHAVCSSASTPSTAATASAADSLPRR